MKRSAILLVIGLVIIGNFTPFVSGLDWSPSCEIKSVNGIYQVGQTVSVNVEGTPNQNPDYPSLPIDRFNIYVFYGDYSTGSYPSRGSSDYIIESRNYDADSNGEATFSFLIGKDGKITIVARCYDVDSHPSESVRSSFYAQPQTTTNENTGDSTTNEDSGGASSTFDPNDIDPNFILGTIMVAVIVVGAVTIVYLLVSKQRAKPPMPPQYQQPPYQSSPPQQS